MLTEKELKAKLNLLKEENFQPPDEQAVLELIPAMMTHIGSIDAELRDGLIYSTFASWVMKYDAIKEATLQEIFKELLGENYLLYKIREKDTDSVFRRSFSALWLPPIIIKHREKAFLSKDDILEAHKVLIRFLSEEKDYRGFVKIKGWAHAIAHAADVLDDLAQCSELNEAEIKEILISIQKIISITNFAYTFGEEERMVTPVIAILQREMLSDIYMNEWIESFSKALGKTKTTPEAPILRTNIKNFLQSLYFRLKWADAGEKLLPTIEKTLRENNIFG